MKTIVFSMVCLLSSSIYVLGQSKTFTDEMMQGKCTFETSGRNTYFILEPNYQLVLENKKGGRLIVTVLNETHKIGNIETRVVEENESENGKTTEISRNFYAYCRENGSVYYFGEEVDIYKDGRVVRHEGAWQAEGTNRAGVMMPGLPLLGSRYYQEIAPGVAMDRAEIVSLSELRETPAGKFTNCLKVEESNPLESNSREFKYYAPGIGLIQDEDLLLTKFGSVRKT